MTHMSTSTVHSLTKMIEPSILNDVLKPYHRTQTNYLRSAHLIEVPLTEECLIRVNGEFSIHESCYIDSTGHFNAVEFIICFNQLAYLAFGYLTAYEYLQKAPVGNLTDIAKDAITKMTYQSYLDKQLSSMFILKKDLSFRQVINPKKFQGELLINKIFFRKNTFFIKTHAKFYDQNKGLASGNVVLAYPLILN